MYRFLFIVIFCCASCKCDDNDIAVVHFAQGILQTNFNANTTIGAQSPNGKFAIGTEIGEILLWDQSKTVTRLLDDNSETQKQLPLHDGPIVALVFTSDGNQLISAGGHAVILWDIPSQKMIRQIRGPDPITALVLDPLGKNAFFGTQKGYMLRWPLDKSEAEGIQSFHCHRWTVTQTRKNLKEAERCPFGTYIEMQDGIPSCAYPVTHLVQKGNTIVRACRDGVLAILNLSTKRIRGYSDGALSVLTLLNENQLFLGLTDGDLKIVGLLDKDEPPYGKVVRTLNNQQKPIAATSSGKFLAIAYKNQINIWYGDSQKPSGALQVPNEVVWMNLKEKTPTLTILLKDGRLVEHKFKLANRDKN